MSISTTLSAAIAAGDASISVADAGGFPLDRQFRVAINRETMLVYGGNDGSAPDTWDVFRDQNATLPSLVFSDAADRIAAGTWGDGWRNDIDSTDGLKFFGSDGSVLTIQTTGNGSAASPRVALADQPLSGEFRFRFMLDKLPSTGLTYLIENRPREVDNAGSRDFYRVRATIHDNGNIDIRAGRSVSGSPVSLGTLVTKAGLFVVDTPYVIAAQAIGSGPTTVNGKVWKESDGEPGAWDVTASDSTAGIQVAGYPAISHDTDALTNFPIVASFNGISYARTSTGMTHAIGDAVVLVEDDVLPIAVIPTFGVPQSALGTGAMAIDYSASPPVAYIRVGAKWYAFGTLTPV